MNWKTALQLLYISLMAFCFWMARAKGEVYVTVVTPVIEPAAEVMVEEKAVTREPAANNACPEILESEGLAQIQQIKMGNGVCAVTLNAKETDYPRRRLIWNSEGKFMSFVAQAVGQGTSAYYIMPTEGYLKVEGTLQQGPDYEVKTSSEMIWSMSKTNPEFHLPSECRGTVTPVKTAQKGGVIITSCKNRLVIDLGWSTKESPEMNRAGVATVRDPQGNACKIPFLDFLNYKSQDEVSPKFTSAEAWHNFLQGRAGCEKLNLVFLKSLSPLAELQPPKPVQ